ncbi:MAG TPA: amidohydrolase family protein [Candidatus Dormibacteraeota bacterium]|nr:amidohydrolase family protein [Candidatus Dormibacteraeota bacterium]
MKTMRRLLKNPATKALTLFAFAITCTFFALHLLAGQPAADAQPAAAMSPFIDVHVHLERSSAASAIQAALQAMRTENAAKLLFLPSPFTLSNATRFDAEFLRTAEKGHRDKLAFLGGGGTLNPMIQEAMRTGNAGPEVQRKFKQLAEEIIRLGAVGFGEMTVQHLPTSTPFQYVPPDHPLFLLLADIAAEHNVPIDLHMEAVVKPMAILPAWHIIPLPNPPLLHPDIAAFERLLDHNPRAKIVWAHAGWDNTGDRTPELTRRLLQAHPNLYMELKNDPLDVGKNPFLTGGATGTIKPAWLKIFQDFPDRFVVGSDQIYPQPKKGPQRWAAVVGVLNQLSPDLRRKIGLENAMRIYGLK